ncbi:PTS glucitol/sorbitol transporter subunit IIA [Amphibacillus jilinensis]|uniref:PTS glucitol/sorbitol transporter subunit IIA n=1 Tax=Amphibacillus jilinensis TaxID=1216008 RepID=UPI000305783A|nr:PTS glucitol/sorbitol transporter subunit IIA [Amphibacillus jilinensis]
MITKYKTTINQIGEMVEDIKSENMLILFGDDAPDELRDFSLSINVNEIYQSFVVGDRLILGDASYEITAIGDAVETNLSALGHITLNFNGATEAELPGTLYLENKPIVNVEPGYHVKIVNR